MDHPKKDWSHGRGVSPLGVGAPSGGCGEKRMQVGDSRNRLLRSQSGARAPPCTAANNFEPYRFSDLGKQQSRYWKSRFLASNTAGVRLGNLTSLEV